MQQLFVYGTLGPGGPNQHILEEIGGTWTPAAIKGRLIQDGWGATLGYPALIIDKGGQDIPGHIFSSETLSAHWQVLDDFEGDGYERLLTDVTLENGETTPAYVYALKKMLEA